VASGRKKGTIGPLGLLTHNGTIARFGGVFKSIAADEAKEGGGVTARTAFKFSGSLAHDEPGTSVFKAMSL
jgi:hypothetical protein